MRKILMITLSLLISVLSGCGNKVQTAGKIQLPAPDKILIAYYSQTGNNAAIAQEIQKQTGGVLYQIKTNLSYPRNVPGTLTQVKREYVQQIRPQLLKDVEDFAKYDLVILGYPNWYDDPPMGVLTFLEKHQWKNKTIAPFVTYGLSGYGTSIETIRKAAPEANVTTGMALHASRAKDSKAEVTQWLNSLQGK